MDASSCEKSAILNGQGEVIMDKSQCSADVELTNNIGLQDFNLIQWVSQWLAVTTTDIRCLGVMVG